MATSSLEADYDVLADADGTMPEIAADWLRASAQSVAGGVDLKSYAYGGDQGLAYDVILPAGTPRGAVIFLHGGFWVQGSKDSVLFAHKHFTDAGLCYVAVTYGLAPRFSLDALVANVEAAAQSFSELAPSIGVDPARIALIGHSAGGYLAAALAASPRGAFKPLGSLLISGLFDLKEIRSLARIEKVGLTVNDAERLSIEGQDLAGRGAFILAVGSREPAGFQIQTSRLAEELRGAGEYPETIVMPGCDHFSVARSLDSADSELAGAVLSLFS